MSNNINSNFIEINKFIKKYLFLATTMVLAFLFSIKFTNILLSEKQIKVIIFAVLVAITIFVFQDLFLALSGSIKHTDEIHRRDEEKNNKNIPIWECKNEEISAKTFHDIRNIASGIHGLAKLIKTRIEDGETRKLQSLIINNSEDLLNILNNLDVYSASKNID